MITVKLYGLIRIESGIKEKKLEASTMKEVFQILTDCGLSLRELQSCVILINGKNSSRRSKLTDGDTVVLMSPVAGG